MNEYLKIGFQSSIVLLALSAYTLAGIGAYKANKVYRQMKIAGPDLIDFEYRIEDNPE